MADGVVGIVLSIFGRKMQFDYDYLVEKRSQITFIRLKKCDYHGYIRWIVLNYKKSGIERGNMYGTDNIKQITEMEREKA